MKMSGLETIFCRTNRKSLCLSLLLQFSVRPAYLVLSPGIAPNKH